MISVFSLTFILIQSAHVECAVEAAQSLLSLWHWPVASALLLFVLSLPPLPNSVPLQLLLCHVPAHDPSKALHGLQKDSLVCLLYLLFLTQSLTFSAPGIDAYLLELSFLSPSQALPYSHLCTSSCSSYLV